MLLRYRGIERVAGSTSATYAAAAATPGTNGSR